MSLLNQTLPKNDYEIIIVDNASTDGTSDYVNLEFLPATNFKLILEPVPGISRARNRGLAESQGRFVAFTDDDAVVGPNWLKNILNAFEHDSCPACVGGKVEAVLEGGRPSWLTADMMDFLAVLDLPMGKTILSEAQYVVGVNMAFDKEKIEDPNFFNESFKKYNDEIFVMNKIRESDGKILYDPEILVKHRIPRERLSWKWFMKRWFWQGASNAYLDIYEKKHLRSKRFFLSYEKIPKIAKEWFSCLTSFLNGRKEEAFLKSKMAFAETGYFAVMMGILK